MNSNVPLRARARRKSMARTAWTCANPSTKAHVRVFTKSKDTAIAHAKKWGCKMLKLRVLVVAEFNWIENVGLMESEVNPFATEMLL